MDNGEQASTKVQLYFFQTLLKTVDLSLEVLFDTSWQSNKYWKSLIRCTLVSLLILCHEKAKGKFVLTTVWQPCAILSTSLAAFVSAALLV